MLVAGVALFALMIAGAVIPVLVVVIAAPLLLAIMRRPQRGVLLLALLVPFDGLLLIAHLPDSANAWKETLVGITLVATFVCPLDARAPRGRVRPAWLAPLVALVLIGVGSAAAAHDLSSVLGVKVDFFYVLLAFAVWRCPLDARERDRLVSIFMMTGFVCALVGLWQQVVGDVALHDLGYEYNTTIRSAGSLLRSFSTFQSPFSFAFYEMMVLLLCLPIALAAPRRARNRAFLLVSPVIALGMMSSIVRASVLGLGVGLAYLGFRRYRLLLAGLPIAFLVALVLGLAGGAAVSSFSSATSFGARQTGWEENFVQIAQHPLGVGIGTTGAAAEKAAKLEFVPANSYNPDNYYFKTVYELGVIGLWMFVLFLIGAFTSTRRAAVHANPRDGPFLDGVGALVLGAATASLVANFFDAFPLDVEFWLLIAIVAAIGAAPRARDRDREEAEAIG